jgi:hypothetical protein
MFAVVHHPLEVAQHRGGPVGRREDAIDEIRSGQMQGLLRDRRGLVGKQRVGVLAEQFLDLRQRHHSPREREVSTAF